MTGGKRKALRLNPECQSKTVTLAFINSAGFDSDFMSKEEAIEVTATVLETCPNAMFKA